jgi:myosin heavy subunit
LQAFVANAEELLGLDAGSLTTLILKRPDDRIGKAAGSLVENKPAEAKVVLDALSRLIYGRTYKFCLQNCSIQSFPSQEAWAADLTAGSGVEGTGASVAVHMVDMPGWEPMEATALGQLHHLMLHYAEEKMHSDFIGIAFSDEIEKFAMEEVECAFVDFPDCGPAMDLLEKPVTGIIQLLEEASVAIKSNDRALVDKIIATHVKTKVA